MPDHKYIYVPTRDLWPAASVNSRLPPIANGEKPIRPTDWLDEHRHVEQMTWAPGEPLTIEGRLVDQGGWIEQPGASAFNLYRPPNHSDGKPNDIGLWKFHMEHIYPNEADHLIKWFAHRVQRPGDKVNHAIVLGGGQGIGKDTLLEPLKAAVGPWNCQEVNPKAMLGRFNGFVKSVVLRVSEARDLGDMDRFAFYDHMKTYTAAPPDVLRCDEKNLREHAVLNCCGIVITTNHKSGGIYLPADDRRHFVAWSEVDRAAFDDAYWRDLWGWYERGGIHNVAAYLRTLDLSDFNAKAPPPKTDAWWHIVNAGRSSEEAEISDALDYLGNPPAVTVSQVMAAANEVGHVGLAEYMSEPKNRRKIPHRLEEVGYESIRNDAAKDGYWKISGRRQPVYANNDLCRRDQIAAAQALAGSSSR
jgi:hypothetical protein